MTPNSTVLLTPQNASAHGLQPQRMVLRRAPDGEVTGLQRPSTGKLKRFNFWMHVSEKEADRRHDLHISLSSHQALNQATSATCHSTGAGVYVRGLDFS